MAKFLPINAQTLISEYSKPLTHPEWKHRKGMCVGSIYKEINNYKISNNKKFLKYFKLYTLFFINVQNGYNWWNIYKFSLRYGIKETSITYEINIKVLYDIVNT